MEESRPEWITNNITKGLISYKKSGGQSDKDKIKMLYGVANRLQEQINEITTYLREVVNNG